MELIHLLLASAMQVCNAAPCNDIYVMAPGFLN